METDSKKKTTSEKSSELSVAKLKMLLKEYYIVVIAFVLVVFSIMILMVPFSKEILTLRGKIQRGKKDLELLTIKESVLSSLDDYELNSQVEILESALPSEKPALYIVDILNASSDKFDLTLGSFEFSPGSLATESADIKKSVKKGIDSISVDVEVSGDFDGLLTYVDYLENAMPLMKAKSIGFSTASRDKEVDVTLELEVYFLPAPEYIGKTSDSLKEISQGQLEAYEKVSKYTKITTRSLPPTLNESRDNPFNY